MKSYKRYMVFASDDYTDSPFDCVRIDTDIKDVALAALSYLDYAAIVFDRVEGKVIKEQKRLDNGALVIIGPWW